MSSLCCTIIVYIQVHQPGNESYVIHKLFFLKQVITTRLKENHFRLYTFGGVQKQLIGIIITQLAEENKIGFRKKITILNMARRLVVSPT